MPAAPRSSPRARRGTGWTSTPLPAAPQGTARPQRRRVLVPILTAAGVHAVLLLALSLLPTAEAVSTQQTLTEERFAEVSLEVPEPPKPKPSQAIAPRAPQPVAQEEAPARQAPPSKPAAAARASAPAGSASERDSSAGSAQVSALVARLGSGSGSAATIEGLGAGVGSGPVAVASLDLTGIPAGEVTATRTDGAGAIATRGSEALAGGLTSLDAAKKGPVRGKVSRVDSAVKVQGQLSRAEISRVVNRSMPAIQGCYERALMQKPGLSGRVLFDWTVATSGAVSGARVRSSSLGDAGVEDCIMRIIRGWRFAAPDGGAVDVTYPFVFRSAS